MLAIAAEIGSEVIQLDVKTAFLCAEIGENVYILMTAGFETTETDGVQLVIKLEKSLYGLARSPQNWWMTIDPQLIKLGFEPLKSEACV